MNISKFRKQYLAKYFFAGFVVASFSLPSYAQVQLEEILVTAQKQEVNLQDATVAVSVVSGEDFDQSNIVKMDNFNGYAPGLVVAKNDGAGRVVSIRGIGWETAQNIASQPSVLTYVDGLYLANPLSMGLDLGEIERVEVFRGPQGTEFGQGTTGGAINLVTKKPVIGESSGYTELALGSYNSVNLRGAANLPLGDMAAFRGSIQKYSRDGFAEISGGEYDGYELDDADSITAKAALLFEPSDSVSILLQTFHQDSDQNAAAQKNIDDPNPDPRELTQDYPGIFQLENTSTSLIIEWVTESGVLIKSMTGYQTLEKRQSVDGDRLTEDTISIDRLGFFTPDTWDVLTYWDNDSDAISQEFNATYNGERFDWILGAYYLDHENFNDFLEATGPSPFSDSIDALENPGPDTLPPFASVLNFTEARTVAREDSAVYAQGTYRFSDSFGITGGVRYQDEKQRDFGNQYFGLFGDFDNNTDDSGATWKFGFDADLTDNNLLYGYVSTGWKNGGTNPGSADAIFLAETFEAEELTSYEIGSKNTFMDDRARLNLTVFYYDHEHLQFIYEDPVPFAGGTGTIPEVEEYGIETEFSFQISESWRLDGMLAFQDGEIKSDVYALDVADFREALEPGLGLFTDAGFAERVALATENNLNGNEPPKMPDLMARFGLSNMQEMDSGLFTSRIEYIYRGEMQARVFNNPEFDSIPSYSIVNLNLGYELAKYPITMGLTVSNLLDEDGINNVFTNPFGIWSTSNEYIPPREVILSAGYSW